MLIEGWNSPRCKLLIDLAPSLSRVRATQKFFRVMTRSGDTEARIYVIIPSALNALPLLPTDLFGNPFEDYECGALVGTEKKGGSRRPTLCPAPTPIEGVSLRKRISFSQSLIRPTINKTNLAHIRRVLQSSDVFDSKKPCGFLEFQRIHFSHPLFVGSGGLLLDHCRIRDSSSYRDWLTKLYPETMANFYLLSRGPDKIRRSNETDLARLFDEGDDLPAVRWEGWLTLGGRLEEQWRSPEDFALIGEDCAKLWRLIDKLKPREQSVLSMRFGLDGLGMCTYREIGDHYERSTELIRQIVAKAIRKIRHWWHKAES